MSTAPGTTVGAGMRATKAPFALQRICRITDPASKGTERLHGAPRRPIAVGRCHAETISPLHGVMEVLKQLVVALENFHDAVKGTERLGVTATDGYSAT